jgi:hypothetical protein
MITIDVEIINYGLEHSIKKMDDYIGEVRALDCENVVKDYIIENHEQSKMKMRRIIDQLNGDEVSETRLVLLSDHEIEVLTEALEERGEV